MTVDRIIERASVDRVLELDKRILSLEKNDYYAPVVGTGTTSYPPTQAEITAILGTPDSFNTEMVGLVRDAVNARQWFVFSDRTTWYYVKASGGFVPLQGTPRVITATPGFAAGYFTVPDVPTYATAVSVTAVIISTIAGQYIMVNKDISAFGHVLAYAQVSGVPNSCSGVVATSDGTVGSYGGNQVFCARSGTATTISIRCNGYFI